MRFICRFRLEFVFIVALVTVVIPAYSQLGQTAIQQHHLDDIISAAKALRGGMATPEISSLLRDGGKCGLWLTFDLARNQERFSAAQKIQLQSLLAQPVTQRDRIIGHFRIYYDTTGFNAPAMVAIDSVCNTIPGSAEEYVDSVGRIFNDVWTYEIDSLGYNAPPLETDGTYHIFIAEKDIFGLYGETAHDANPINSSSPYRYKTYISIDNDYCNVYRSSRGMPALKVTAAHEFHHAIQIGSYGEWPNDLYFYEITSTWLEDVLYPEVNDYYQYLKYQFDSSIPCDTCQRGQFRFPNKSFTSMSDLLPYSRAIWGKFLEKKFSREIIRQTWVSMRQIPSIPSMDNVLTVVGSSFRQAFLEWAIWNYHTGPSSDSISYYTESRQYPQMRLSSTHSYDHSPSSVTDNIEALSSAYHPICILPNASASCGASPQILALITNLNIASANSNERYSFTYDIADGGDESFKRLSNGIYVRLNVADPQNWTSQESVPGVVTDVLVFPNPFVPKEKKPLNFQLPSASQSTAVLYIYGSSMNQVASVELPIVYPVPLEPRIQWNGLGVNGEPIPTGVYFYLIVSDERQFMGKFAVTRE